MIVLKSDRELDLMREAGRIVAGTLDLMCRKARSGITTGELDRLAEEYIVGCDATPAFKGLYGFPATICASINDELVHGIPGERKLHEGDILSIDVGVAKHGFNGDAAITLPIGSVSDDVRKLLRATEEALYQGIEEAVVGNRLSDISNAIQVHIESHGLSVVRDYVGHGIGRKVHEDPQIPNFGPPGKGPVLKTGMTVALEPMANLGTHEVDVDENRWTVKTVDGKASAHFEHTVAILDDGPEILTRL